MDAHVAVNNVLEITGGSAELFDALKKATTHSNPEFFKKKAMGMWTGGTPSKLVTWRQAGPVLAVPRGVMSKLRAIAAEVGDRLILHDQRVSIESDWPAFVADPGSATDTVSERRYQVETETACREREQGIVRSPTGSGKTHVALSVFSKIRQRTLVIVRDRQLLEQWVKKARKHLGMETPQIGVVRGGRKHAIGTCLTLALQQTLWTKSFPLAEFARQFGVVAVDEVHLAAARTVSQTIDAFPARYRFGFSADETRKDKKEFLIYDLFGEVIYEITRSEVEELGYTCPVVVRLVPTRFRADWYRNAPPEERDFKRLIDEMTTDSDRNALIRHVVLVMVREKQDIPALVFTHRREHGHRLSTELLAADGIACGLMMGSKESAAAFEESRELLEKGRLPVAVGTFNAIGTGIDIPNVRAGIVATPLGNNRQNFNQVRGRLCRPSKGKSIGHLYYLWDREVFPYAVRNLHDWNDGNVEMLDSDTAAWVPVDAQGEPE
jgi:superfamily II DNA or RNA helicase